MSSNPTGVAFLFATLLILVAEIWAGRDRGAYSWQELKVTLLCGAIGVAITRPLSALAAAFLFATIAPGFQHSLEGVPFIYAVIGILLLSEFGFYWAHRLAHESRTTRFSWFWGFHRTHHSGKFMNVLLNFRVLPLWSFIVPNTWIWGLSVYLGLGSATAVVIVIATIWNLVTHANFRWDDAIRAHPRWGKPWRALEHVIVTPGIHHTHHGYGKDGASYRNFGVVLSLYDTLFGTLHIPDGRPFKYGLPGPNEAHWTREVFFPLGRG